MQQDEGDVGGEGGGHGCMQLFHLPLFVILLVDLSFLVASWIDIDKMLIQMNQRSLSQAS
jgi:hypothetical protein